MGNLPEKRTLRQVVDEADYYLTNVVAPALIGTWCPTTKLLALLRLLPPQGVGAYWALRATAVLCQLQSLMGTNESESGPPTTRLMTTSSDGARLLLELDVALAWCEVFYPKKK